MAQVTDGAGQPASRQGHGPASTHAGANIGAGGTCPARRLHSIECGLLAGSADERELNIGSGEREGSQPLPWYRGALFISTARIVTAGDWVSLRGQGTPLRSRRKYSSK